MRFLPLLALSTCLSSAFAAEVPIAPGSPAPNASPAATETNAASGAGPLAGLKVSGSARVRVEADNFTDYGTLRNFTSVRVRPSFTYAIDDKISAVFTPQFAKIFGDRPLAFNAAGTAGVAQRTSGATIDQAVGFHEGYLLYRPTENLEFTAGRRILSYGEEVIVGAADWGVVGRSFDVFRSRVSYGNGWTDVFASKLADTNTQTSGPGDADYYGFYNSQDFGPALSSADLYAFFLRDGTSLPRQETLAVGVRLKSSFDTMKEADEGFRAVLKKMDYRIEATAESGTAVAHGHEAYQVDAEVGYLFRESSKSRFGIQGAIAGQNFNQQFASPHRWFGYADAFGRRNIVDFAAHLSSNFGSDLSAQFSFHKFFRNSDQAPAYRTDGTTAVGSVARSSSKDLGMEGDLTLKYKLSKAATFIVGGSLLRSGDFLKGQYREPRFYHFSLEAKF